MQPLIKNILQSELPEDIYEFGFASLANLLSPEYQNYKYGIAVIRKLESRIIDGIKYGPTMEYFNHYHEINRELNSKLEKISIRLNENGIKNLGIKSTVDDAELEDSYYKTLRLNFSHKLIATRSGLGWIGKTDLLVSKRFGPGIRLISLLIDAEVKSEAEPIDESLCGRCNFCVDSCPAEAATGKLWNIHVDRNEFFDPFKCRENCRMLSKEKLNKDISLCGICISVCPKRNI